MKKVDEKYVVIIDDNSFYDIYLWDKYTSCSNIDGLFYLDYKRGNNYKGEIIWSNNKPIVSCRDLLWDDLENEDELIEVLENDSKAKIYEAKQFNDDFIDKLEFCFS